MLALRDNVRSDSCATDIVEHFHIFLSYSHTILYKTLMNVYTETCSQLINCIRAHLWSNNIYILYTHHYGINYHLIYTQELSPICRHMSNIYIYIYIHIHIHNYTYIYIIYYIYTYIHILGSRISLDILDPIASPSRHPRSPQSRWLWPGVPSVGRCQWCHGHGAAVLEKTKGQKAW